ncbi:MAG: T9SS type A sorting domain-containing protein [Bacteroidetes bacterium]|nr:T9SS type A sorting domain-containing protein [Bacteroidota bacterium]
MMTKKFLSLSIAFAWIGLCFAQVPTSGLVAYFPFDKDSVSDISGNSRNLVPTLTSGNYSLVSEGKFGKALNTSFPANNSHALMGTQAQFRFESSFSISVWVKAGTQFLSSYAVIAGNRRNKDFSIYNNYALLFNGTSSELQFIVADNTIGTNVTAGDFLNWLHVVATYDQGTARLYVDGELRAESFNFPTQITYGTEEGGYYLNKFQLGNFSGIGNHSFQHLIDEVAIYDRALSKRDVLAIYHAMNNRIDEKAPWTLSDVNGMPIEATEFSGKDSTTLATVANSENFIWDLKTKTFSQLVYGQNSKLADEIKMASNGNVVFRKGASVYFKNQGGNFISVPEFRSSSIAINSTDILCSGAKFVGLYRLENNNWTLLNNDLEIARMDLADDGTLAFVTPGGTLGFLRFPSLVPIFDSNQVANVKSISVVDSTLIFAASFDGEIYRIERGRWTLVSAEPYVDRVLALQDGSLYALINNFVYRYKDNFTKGSQPTALPGELKQHEISMFPNPASDHFTIQINALEKPSKLSLCSMQGVEIELSIRPDGMISLMGVEEGLYLLKLQTESGKVFNKKLLIAR